MYVRVCVYTEHVIPVAVVFLFDNNLYGVCLFSQPTDIFVLAFSLTLFLFIRRRRKHLKKRKKKRRDVKYKYT